MYGSQIHSHLPAKNVRKQSNESWNICQATARQLHVVALSALVEK
jgi:hypothetical protein